jgi:hypothetical protein
MLNLVFYLLLGRMKIDNNHDESQRNGNGRSDGPEKRCLALARPHAESE